jgi:hypothetical protein
MTTVKFDGYTFGDRILEGMYFLADVDGHKISNVRIAPESDGEYWRGLSHTRWIKEARRFITDVIDENGSAQGAIDAEEVEEYDRPASDE